MTLKTQQNKHQLETDICISIFYQSIFPAPSFHYFIIKHIAPENGIATVYPIHLHLPDWPGNVLRGTWHLSACRYHRKGKDGHHLPHIHLSVHLSVYLSAIICLYVYQSVHCQSVHLPPSTYILSQYLAILSSVSLSSMWRMLILYLKKETSSKENFKSKVQSLR